MGSRKRSSGRRGCSPADVRRIACSLPGVQEGTSYGTGAFRVGSKLFLRFHQDGESLVARTDEEERSTLLAANPDVYFITDHYREHPWVQVRLAAIERSELASVIEYAWRLRASARRITELDGG